MNVTLVFADDAPRTVEVEVLTAAGESTTRLRVDDSSLVVPDLVVPALVTLRGKGGVWTGWIEPGVFRLHVELSDAPRCQVLDADEKPIVGMPARYGSVTDAGGFTFECSSSAEPIHLPLRHLDLDGKNPWYPDGEPDRMVKDDGHAAVVGVWTPVGVPLLEERATATGYERRRIEVPVDAPPTYGPWEAATGVRLTESEPFAWTPVTTPGLAWRDDAGTIVVFPRVYPTRVKGATADGLDVFVNVEAGDVSREVSAPVDNRVEGGSVGGVIGGAPPSGAFAGTAGAARTVHYSDVLPKKRVTPAYPEEAMALNLGVVDCQVRILLDVQGAPKQVGFVACPEGFQKATEDAVMASRWYPVKVDGAAVAAQFVAVYRYNKPEPE